MPPPPTPAADSDDALDEPLELELPNLGEAPGDAADGWVDDEPLEDLTDAGDAAESHEGAMDADAVDLAIDTLTDEPKARGDDADGLPSEPTHEGIDVPHPGPSMLGREEQIEADEHDLPEPLAPADEDDGGLEGPSDPADAQVEDLPPLDGHRDDASDDDAGDDPEFDPDLPGASSDRRPDRSVSR